MRLGMSVRAKMCTETSWCRKGLPTPSAYQPACVRLPVCLWFRIIWPNCLYFMQAFSSLPRIPVYRSVLNFFCQHLPTYLRLPVCLYFGFYLFPVCIWISTYRGGCLPWCPPTNVSTSPYTEFCAIFIFSLGLSLHVLW